MVDVTTDGGVAVVTLNRPEARNALDTATIAGLTAALHALDADDAVDAIILTGADPAFCAGLDLKELGATGGIMGEGRAETEAARRGGPIPPLRLPLIGAINGPAITGGLEIALNCDFLVASERALFGDTHARVGLQPGWGGAVLLVEAIGVRRAREMSFTGNFVDAQEALRIGLVNHVVAARRAAAVLHRARRRHRRRRPRGDAAAAPHLRRDRRRRGRRGWDAEAEAARGWQGRNFDAAEIERRREAIRTRGREQASR